MIRDLYILPSFATESTCPSSYIHCLGGVVLWLDRNPEGRYQVSCKFEQFCVLSVILYCVFCIYVFVFQPVFSFGGDSIFLFSLCFSFSEGGESLLWAGSSHGTVGFMYGLYFSWRRDLD